jgi:hypothetical protein
LAAEWRDAVRYVHCFAFAKDNLTIDQSRPRVMLGAVAFETRFGVATAAPEAPTDARSNLRHVVVEALAFANSFAKISVVKFSPLPKQRLSKVYASGSRR